MPNGKPYPCNDPAIQKQVAQLAVTGMPNITIADQIGVAPSTVGLMLKKDQIKSIIETEQAKFLSLLPAANNNIKQVVSDFYNPITQTYHPDNQVRYFGFRASEKILESVGILANNTSTNVINIVNQQNNLTLSPVIQSLLTSYNNDAEVIDADPTEDHNP